MPVIIDYGALIAPGGAPIGTNYYGSGGPGYAYGTANTGITNYLDGVRSAVTRAAPTSRVA